MRHRLVAAALLLAACGNPPASGAQPAGSAPPATAAVGPTDPSGGGRETLFAVLEPGGDLTQMRNNVVAIVRMDGTAKAKSSFKPRQLPQVRVAVVLPQPEARVAGGKVFFADGAGVVRSLAPDGTVAEVTAFPLTNSQQMLSFAVSPDGSRLLGAVFAFPQLHSPAPQTAADPLFAPGDFTLDLSTAAAGEPAKSLTPKRTWSQSAGIPQDALSLVGWSATSALATVDTSLGTQQGAQGRRIFGHVAELDQSGKPGLAVGGADCQAWTVLPDETVLCDDGVYQKVSVRARGGAVISQPLTANNTQYVDLTLAPDASRLTYRDVTTGKLFVLSLKDGVKAELPPRFQPQGWISPSILIGALSGSRGPGDMALVRLGNPARVEDLGFHGFFVGVVQGG